MTITFKELAEAVISPLVTAGWSRRGRIAYLRQTDAIVQIGFQKYDFDNSYFIRCGIWLLALGDPGYPAYGENHLQFRLEHLAPELADVMSLGVNLNRTTADDLKAL